MSDDLGDRDANAGDDVASDDDVANSDDAARDEVADDPSDDTTQPTSRSSRFREFANQLDEHSDTDDQSEPGSTRTPADSASPAAESEPRQSTEDVSSWEWLGGTEESDRDEGDETKREERDGPDRDEDTDSETRSTADSDRTRSRIWNSGDTGHAETADQKQDSQPDREPADSHESSGHTADDSLGDSPNGSTGGPARSPSESHTHESMSSGSNPDPTPDDETDGVTDFLRGGSATDTGSDDVTTGADSPLDPASAGGPEPPGSSEESTADTDSTDATPTESTGAGVPSPEEPASAEEQPRKRRIWSDDGDSSATTAASAGGESTTPTNRAGRAGTDGDVSDHLSGTPSTPESETPSTVGSAFEADETTKYSRPDGFQPELGTSTMVQCGAQDDEKHAACLDLIGVTTDVTPRNVLLVQYREIDREELIQISDWASQTKVIAVGYSQPIPDAVSDTVEVITINNPNAITRLGIVISGTVDSWQSAEYETVVCYDSLNVLLEYTDTQRTFRFLHVLLGTLRKRNTISHFHVDPMAADVQQVNTLTPLFDSILSIDSMGTHLE